MSVHMYQTTRRHIPHDHNLHIHRRGNHKPLIQSKICHLIFMNVKCGILLWCNKKNRESRYNLGRELLRKLPVGTRTRKMETCICRWSLRKPVLKSQRKDHDYWQYYAKVLLSDWAKQPVLCAEWRDCSHASGSSCPRSKNRQPSAPLRAKLV